MTQKLKEQFPSKQVHDIADIREFLDEVHNIIHYFDGWELTKVQRAYIKHVDKKLSDLKKKY